MSCYCLPRACLVVAMLAGPASLLADEHSAEEIETVSLGAGEAKRIAEGWVQDVVVTGDRSITLTGERDQVQQAIGAVMLADQRFADNDPEQTGVITRVFAVKHADPRALEALIKRTVQDVHADPTLQVVVVTGFAEQVESATAVLAELDVPPKVTSMRDVVIDVYLIGAFSDAHESIAMPAVPQRAVDGIRETFPFVSYRLLEAFTVRASPGGNDARVTGYLDSDPLISRYQFRVRVESGQEALDSIRLKNVELVLGVSGKEIGVQESEIQTDLTTQESKTVVVGKAGVRGVADGVFLVLRARFE